MKVRPVFVITRFQQAALYISAVLAGLGLAVVLFAASGHLCIANC